MQKLAHFTVLKKLLSEQFWGIAPQIFGCGELAPMKSAPVV